jgi:hypothetical protein
MVNVPVTIIAPTETATFSISGLPAGVTDTYKESESNPSGLLTLVAISTTVPGTYMPVITVGSSGQTASVVFTLVISAPAKAGLESGVAKFGKETADLSTSLRSGRDDKVVENPES